MQTKTKQLLALALTAMMVMGAGCAGWGTDGPADTENDTNESNASDDLNETQNDSNTSESDSGTDTSSGTDESGDSSDQESTASSDDESSSEGDSATGSSDSNSGGQDTQDGSADDGDSSTESDGQSDSDSDQTDSKNTDDSDDQKDTDEKNSDDSDDPTTSPPEDGDNESPPDEDNETPPENGDNETDPDPEPEGNTVTIDVRDLETDEPVDIPVRLNGIDTDYEETVNSTDGTATFENVPNGDYDVTTTSSEWWPQYPAIIEIAVDGDTSYTLGVDDDLDTHTMTVTVEDAETGEPIEGADVSGVGGRHPDGADLLVGGETNAEGVLTVDAYESGYLINVSADGYEIPPNQEVDLTEDKSVSFELTPEEPPTQPPANETNETGNETAAAA